MCVCFFIGVNICRISLNQVQALPPEQDLNTPDHALTHSVQVASATTLLVLTMIPGGRRRRRSPIQQVGDLLYLIDYSLGVYNIC